LLVEDDRLLRRAFTNTLTSFDIDLFVSEHPLDALRRLEEGLRPTLILSDLQMPPMDGDELCRVVREKYPEVEFVLMSGNAAVYGRGHTAGAHHVHMKPISREILRALILGE
jgi:CheY-like chemotaxis protein